MTEDMMALRGLLEKSADADLLREMIGFAAEFGPYIATAVAPENEGFTESGGKKGQSRSAQSIKRSIDSNSI